MGEFKLQKDEFSMTQYEKNSKFIAVSSYNSRKRAKRLREELIIFFSALSIICTGLYIIISSAPC